MIDRRLALHFDWVLVVLALSVASAGLVAIYSASYVKGTQSVHPLVWKQLLWIGIGLLGMGMAFIWDYRFLEKFSHALYGLSLFLLVLVPIFGSSGGGSQRWLRLGMVSLQPSEFMKLSLMILLAKRFQTESTNGTPLKEIVLPLTALIVPLGLIVVQPDLGTTLALVVLFVTMILAGGVRFRALVPLALGSLAVIPLVWKYLKPYQQKRVLTFFNPDLDPMGAGYHALQSKIAIGSGQIAGKGFLHGTQNQLYFLPEQHTDFVFSVFAEEWGFVGASFLMALYLFLVLWALHVAQHARDQFGALLATGTAAIFFWQVAINVGMVTGVLPVVGIPLPLMSYGGSSMLTMMVGIGLLINVSMRRYSPMRV